MLSQAGVRLLIKPYAHKIKMKINIMIKLLLTENDHICFLDSKGERRTATSPLTSVCDPIWEFNRHRINHSMIIELLGLTQPSQSANWIACLSPWFALCSLKISFVLLSWWFWKMKGQQGPQKEDTISISFLKNKTRVVVMCLFMDNAVKVSGYKF